MMMIQLPDPKAHSRGERRDDGKGGQEHMSATIVARARLTQNYNSRWKPFGRASVSNGGGEGIKYLYKDAVSDDCVAAKCTHSSAPSSGVN